MGPYLELDFGRILLGADVFRFCFPTPEALETFCLKPERRVKIFQMKTLSFRGKICQNPHET